MGSAFFLLKGPVGTPVALQMYKRGRKGGLAMMSNEELQKLQEEQEVMNTWRKVSRHVVADLLEGCSVCSTVRERDLLLLCPWCKDVFLCPGECMQEHNTQLHATVSFWSK
jgi:hypothetical protein